MHPAELLLSFHTLHFFVLLHWVLGEFHSWIFSSLIYYSAVSMPFSCHLLYIFFVIGSSGFMIAIFSYHSEDTDWSTLKMCYSLLFQPFAPVFIPLVVRFMPLSCSVSFLKHWWLLIVSLPLCLRISGGVMLPRWMCQFPIILLVQVTCTEYEPEGDHQWSHFKVPFSAALPSLYIPAQTHTHTYTPQDPCKPVPSFIILLESYGNSGHYLC